MYMIISRIEITMGQFNQRREINLGKERQFQMKIN